MPSHNVDQHLDSQKNDEQLCGRTQRSPSLTLDLSDVPSLSSPSPPSNTILVTNLQDVSIFASPILKHIETLIERHSPDGIHSFCPLRSMRRIIISFWSVESAVKIRQILDGESIFGNRVRVYFGKETPLYTRETAYLAAPRLEKQFFISPPPSPPAGWEVREEDPPNKEVHAEDLVKALERLSHTSLDAVTLDDSPSLPPTSARRQRSGTGTIVYAPEDHGHSPDLPAIAVEDTTASPIAEDLDLSTGGGRIVAHTSRPPLADEIKDR